MSVEAEPSHPPNEVNSTCDTCDIEKRPPNRRLTQCRVIVCAANTYSAEQRVFIVREYWRMGTFTQCQRAFWSKYGEGSVLIKSCIHKLVETLETRRRPEDV
jgi:hypothetical protein